MPGRGISTPAACGRLAAALLAVAVASDSAGRPEHDKPSFSLRPSIGLFEGRSREIVYDFLRQGAGGPRTGAGGDKISELTWDLSGLAFLGLGAVAELKHGFGLSFDYRAALNRGRGRMDNYDWLGPGDEWTDWSRSDVLVEAAEMMDARAALPLRRRGGANICRGLIGYRRTYWRWSDRGREFVYSENGFRDARGSFEGRRLIDYQQTFSVPYAGAVVNARRDAFSLDAALLLSHFVMARDHDYHRLRNTHFEERFAWGRYAALETEAAWAVRRGLRLTVAFEARIIPEIVGDMTIVEDNLTLPSSAGIAHEAVMGTAGMEWVF